MYPLLKWGFIELSTNYLMIYLAIILAIVLFLVRAKNHDIEMIRAIDITIFMVITLIVGARLFYIILCPDPLKYVRNPLEIFKIWKGGFASSGGAGLFLLVTFWYCRKFAINWRKVFDLLITSGFLGIGLSRIGCFLAGCCYGLHTDSWLGIVYRQYASIKPVTGIPLGVPLWPTQLALALNGFICAALSWWYFKRRRFDGEVFLLGTILFTSLCFLIEYYREFPFRYDIFSLQLSSFQVSALIYLPVTLGIYFVAVRKYAKFSFFSRKK